MRRSSNFSQLLTTLIFAALMFAEGLGNAADIPRAERLINEAIELRRAGQDAQALPKFEEGYRLNPSPRASAQWGLCLQAVGRWSEADAKISEALKSKSDPWVMKNRSILKESLEQVKQNVARVEVYGGPDGATVTVNGRNVGTYPLAEAVVVNAGNLDIEVTKPGLKRGYRAMTIAGGRYERVLIRLEEPEKGSALPPTLLPIAAASTPQGSLSASPEPAAQESPAIYSRPWFWIAAGAIVIGGAVALALATSGKTGPTVDDQGTFKQ